MGRIITALSAIDADDVFFFVGLALVSAGAFQAYRPAGPIVFGLGLLWLSTRPT